MVSFQVSVDGSVVYDWRPDQSNPAPPTGTTYTPSRVALGFGVTCGRSHTVSLQGRDTGDGSSFNLGSTPAIPCPTPDPALTFYALTPCRVIDTRNVAGPDAGAPVLAPGETRIVGMVQKCGIPVTAAALSVNVTVTAPTAAGRFTLYAADGALPVASQLSFAAAQTRASATIVPLAVDATGFKVRNGSAGSSHLIVDVNGYFESTFARPDLRAAGRAAIRARARFPSSSVVLTTFTNASPSEPSMRRWSNVSAT